jgi:hypothetical protein
MTMTTQPQRDDTELLHRLLDEAFAPYPVTPESLDLKQEVRGNLAARTSELVAEGATPADAARRALAELGDVGILLGETPTDAPASTESWVAEQRRNRVRPKPAYAVRTAVLAGLLGVVILVLKFEAFGLLTIAPVLSVAAIPIAAVLVGWIVGDALRQETTQNYPFARPTAIAFGVAAALLTAGIGAIWQIILQPGILWILIAGGTIVASIALFTYLGVTRTNRRKPWALRLMNAQGNVPNAFDTDQATAARFGMYTAGIFTVAFAAFIVLTFTIGWAWSWLALVGGFVVMLMLLARMLFPPTKR